MKCAQAKQGGELYHLEPCDDNVFIGIILCPDDIGQTARKHLLSLVRLDLGAEGLSEQDAAIAKSLLSSRLVRFTALRNILLDMRYSEPITILMDVPADYRSIRYRGQREDILPVYRCVTEVPLKEEFMVPNTVRFSAGPPELPDIEVHLKRNSIGTTYIKVVELARTPPSGDHKKSSQRRLESNEETFPLTKDKCVVIKCRRTQICKLYSISIESTSSSSGKSSPVRLQEYARKAFWNLTRNQPSRSMDMIVLMPSWRPCPRESKTQCF